MHNPKNLTVDKFKLAGKSAARVAYVQGQQLQTSSMLNADAGGEKSLVVLLDLPVLSSLSQPLAWEFGEALASHTKAGALPNSEAASRRTCHTARGWDRSCT